MKKVILFLAVCLLLGMGLFGCKMKTAQQTPETLLEKYKSILLKLDKDNVDSILNAAEKYKEIFKNEGNSAIKDKAFDEWQQLYSEILDKENNKLEKDKELNEDLCNAETIINYKPDGKQKISKKTAEYIDKRKKNGINIYMSEGNYYLDNNYDFINEHFLSFLSESYQGYQKIRANEFKEGFTEDACLMIPWDSIRKRIIIWEKYLKEYPESTKTEAAKSFINEYLEVYLSGLDNSRLYSWEQISEENPQLLPEIKKSYETFIKENSDSPYCPLIKKYYHFLEKNSFVIHNSEIKEYLQKENLDSMLGMQPALR